MLLQRKDVCCGFCWSAPSLFLTAAREDLISLHMSSVSFHGSFNSCLEAGTAHMSVKGEMIPSRITEIQNEWDLPPTMGLPTWTKPNEVIASVKLNQLDGLYKTIMYKSKLVIVL